MPKTTTKTAAEEKAKKIEKDDEEQSTESMQEDKKKSSEPIAVNDKARARLQKVIAESDLETLAVGAVRKQLEEEFSVTFDKRAFKKAVNAVIEEMASEKADDDDDDDDDDNNDDDDDDVDEEEDSEEEEEKKAKEPTKKRKGKNPVGRPKKAKTAEKPKPKPKKEKAKKEPKKKPEKKKKSKATVEVAKLRKILKWMDVRLYGTKITGLPDEQVAKILRAKLDDMKFDLNEPVTQARCKEFMHVLKARQELEELQRDQKRSTPIKLDGPRARRGSAVVKKYDFGSDSEESSEEQEDESEGFGEEDESGDGGDESVASGSDEDERVVESDEEEEPELSDD